MVPHRWPDRFEKPSQGNGAHLRAVNFGTCYQLRHRMDVCYQGCRRLPTRPFEWNSRREPMHARRLEFPTVRQGRRRAVASLLPPDQQSSHTLPRPALIKLSSREFCSWRCIGAHGKFPAIPRQSTTDLTKIPSVPRLPTPARGRSDRNSVSRIWPSA